MSSTSVVDPRAVTGRHRVAYILLVHHLPGQVIRLVDRLDGPDVEFYVHVDRGSPINGTLVRSLDRVNVRFVRRRHAHWASYGVSAAQLECLRAARDAGFDHAVLLSGQDYPIKSPARVREELRGLGERSLLEHEPLPIDDWNGGFDRIRRYHLRTWGRAPLSLPGRRTLPCGLRPYGGASWWTLSRYAAGHILDMLERHPAIARFFRTTRVPDEILFQTLLLNSPLADSIVNMPSTYADWSERGERRPAVLRPSDLPKLAAVPHLFARKFDEQRFPGMLDLVDAELRRDAEPATPLA